MHILYFAWLRERIGHSEERVDLPAEVTTVAACIAWLSQQSEAHALALSDPSRIRAAVNEVHAGDDTAVSNADRLALFPPVTGG